MPLPIREFTTEAQRQLEALGLRKRAGDNYTVALSDDFLGFVGLGRAMKHGALRIWPTVGVRHQPTERALANLLEHRFHAYSPPTIVGGLGYLMPERRWIEWLVESGEVEASAAEIAHAIREFGLSAIRRNASLPAILAALTSHQAMSSPRDDYLRPVVLVELGRRQEADAELSRQVEARRRRSDPDAEQFRRFAAAFTDWAGLTARSPAIE